MAPSILGLASAILGIPTITTFIQNLISALTRNSEYIENVQCTRNQLQEFEDEDLLGKMSILLTPTGYSDGSLNTIIPPYQVLPTELVTNGTFDTDTDWNLNSGVTISGGTMNFTSTPGSYGSQDIGVKNGVKYKITFEITSETSGSLIIFLGAGNNVGVISGLGKKEIIATASTNLDSKLYFGNVFTGSIDNVSVKEIQEADFDFSRGSSATRVNEQGLVEDVQILSGELVQNGNFEEIGSELVTNGNFDTDSDWIKETGWSISDGKANKTSSVASNFAQLNTGVFTNNNMYKITFTISNSNDGRLLIYIGGNSVTIDITNATNGTYTFYAKADGQDYLIFRNATSGFQGSIDNVSVKEVGQNWTFGTGWSMGDGVALYDSSGNAGYITQSNVLEINKKYKLTATVNSGIVSLVGAFYDVEQGTQIQTGVDSIFTVKSANGSLLRLYSHPNNGDAEITDISVVQITDDTDLPRIDYSPYSGAGTCGHLLLEPQRTNLITYSENLTDSSWAKQSGGTGTAPIVTSNNTISPDGTQNADKVVFNKGTGTTTSDFSILSASFTSQSNTASFYVKADSSQRIVVRNSNTFVGYDIGTDWTRIEKTDTGGSIQIGLRDGYGVADVPNTATVYLWGVQVEAADYATSYIPTSGTTVTRSAETANNSGNADLFNDSEGVLYAEIAALADDGTNRRISISNDSTQNRVVLMYHSTSNVVRGFVSSGGSLVSDMTYTVSDTTQFNKIAFSYKQDDFKLWIDGVQRATDDSGAAPIGLNTLRFEDGNGSFDFYGKVRNVQVFTEALTDAELQELTS